ncbi:RES family NAD+ phosphorylase [Pantoea sp. GM01]|uniref:RES family NAD+ phosphorylase n=1 Tax=Pantoea sp. GM01 TaxID=1144320 RepID=UPI000270F7E2|nr:RES family NAD+ phosphorylase [Pantoea sp. GM01]EJL93198.1 RES domain-containing protein [Pantoea sp. GM01]
MFSIQEDTSHLSLQDSEALRKIDALSDLTIASCSIFLPAGTRMVRLQEGAHGGSSVFFNHDGRDTRYGLVDGKNGTMYTAPSPKTAMKEVFQKRKGMTESDLERYFIADIVMLTGVQLLQTSQLVIKTSITVHDLTTGSRLVTQLLARRACDAGLNGIEFMSNVAQQTCYALWHSDPAGKEMAITQDQIRLSDFIYEGTEAADILTFELGIPVEE